MSGNKKWVRIEVDVKVEPGAVFVEGERISEFAGREILRIAAEQVPKIRKLFPPYEDPAAV